MCGVASTASAGAESVEDECEHASRAVAFSLGRSPEHAGELQEVAGFGVDAAGASARCFSVISRRQSRAAVV
jgi:hypothetical protein